MKFALQTSVSLSADENAPLAPGLGVALVLAGRF